MRYKFNFLNFLLTLFGIAVIVFGTFLYAITHYDIHAPSWRPHRDAILPGVVLINVLVVSGTLLLSYLMNSYLIRKSDELPESILKRILRIEAIVLIITSLVITVFYYSSL